MQDDFTISTMEMHWSYSSPSIFFLYPPRASLNFWYLGFCSMAEMVLMAVLLEPI
jgi:hypothetical protein